MPPGIIADINSVSARQRQSLRRQHGRAAVGERAFDPMMRARTMSAHAAVLASFSANSSISSPHRAACSSASSSFCGFVRIAFFLGAPLQPPLVGTLEHFRKK
jgi:hypothetical protein